MNPLNVLRALLAELVDWFNGTFGRTPDHVPQHRKSRDGKRPLCLHCQTVALMRELKPAIQPAHPTLVIGQQPEPLPEPEPEQEPEPESPTVPAMQPVQPTLFEFACGDGTGAIDWPTGTFRLHVIHRPKPEPYPDVFDTRGVAVPVFYQRRKQAALLTLGSVA